MSLADELDALDDEPQGRAKLVALGDVAQRALAADDLRVAIAAKQEEAQLARNLGMHQHAVVVCAEVVELWPRVRELPAEDVATRIVWTLKHGAGSAMDLPEIPLATIRDLLRTLAEILAHYGAKTIALWELEARLGFIEDDRATLHDRIARIAPTISVSSHVWDYADCPGCMVMQIVDYMNDRPIEEIEAVTAPLLSPDPFPPDREHGRVMSLFFDNKLCSNAERTLPAHLARAYARTGRLAQARLEADRAVAASATLEAERRMYARVAALEVALATGDRARISEHAAAVASVVRDVEDPYEQLRAVLALHRAARVLEQPELAAWRAQALALARRVDARLVTPRHERETLAALDARDG